MVLQGAPLRLGAHALLRAVYIASTSWARWPDHRRQHCRRATRPSALRHSNTAALATSRSGYRAPQRCATPQRHTATQHGSGHVAAPFLSSSSCARARCAAAHMRPGANSRDRRGLQRAYPLCSEVARLRIRSGRAGSVAVNRAMSCDIAHPSVQCRDHPWERVCGCWVPRYTPRELLQRTSFGSSGAPRRRSTVARYCGRCRGTLVPR